MVGGDDPRCATLAKAAKNMSHFGTLDEYRAKSIP
jgi:hypothetical protein